MPHTPGFDTEQLIGMPAYQAKAVATENGMRIRPTMINGQGLMHTEDYRTDRVNVSLENGIVTEADVG